jgi:monoamine oxidase
VTERVVVIGAGFAGLRCARELLARGVDVDVVEARGHPGGRVATVDASVHPPVELGAHVLHGRCGEVAALGHPLREVPRGMDVRLSFRGKRLRPAVLEAVGLSPLRAQYRLSAEPDASLGSDTVGQWIARTARSADHAVLMGHWLAQNWSGPVDDLEAASVARPHRDAGLASAELIPDGGFAALVSRLAGDVPIAVHTPVRRVVVRADGVLIELYDGSTRAASRCVLTASPSVVANGRLELDGVPAQKRQAADRLALGDGCSAALRLSAAAPADQFVLDVDGGLGLVQSWQGSPWVRLDCKGPQTAELRELLGDADRLASRLATLLPWTGQLHELDRQVADWGRDPWIGGVFSLPRPGSVEAAARWRAPERDRLFVAGEATYCGTLPPYVSTALRSGRVAAEQVLERI